MPRDAQPEDAVLSINRYVSKHCARLCPRGIEW
jgi:hypothetical protein